MNQKEQLKERIEGERKKLNELLASGDRVEDAYEQSRAVDRLIEQYLDCKWAGRISDREKADAKYCASLFA